MSGRIIDTPLPVPYTSGLDDGRELNLSQSHWPLDSGTEIRPRYFDFAQVARLNLSEPWVGKAVEALREKGYFLGGLLPRRFDADGLLLSRVFHRPHWEGMQIHFERGRKIVQMAGEDWERTQAAASSSPPCSPCP